MEERRALYVRIPLPAAEKLDRAAFEMQVPKQDLVADLLFRHLQPGSASRRLVLESTEDTMTVGHHSFVPAEPSEVLNVVDVADLLRVDEAVVVEMADKGELPGRK